MKPNRLDEIVATGRFKAADRRHYRRDYHLIGTNKKDHGR